MTARHAIPRLISIFALTASCLAARAQENSDDRSPVAEPSPLRITLSADPRLTFRSDVRDADADVLVSNNGFGARAVWTVNPDFRLVFGLGGEVSIYDWDNGENVMPGGSESFEDVYSVNALIVGRHTVSGPWSFILGGIGRAQGESDADFGDSVTAGGFVAAGYNFSEASWIDFGVGVFTRLDDDPLVIPYINVRYPISERVRLEINGLEGGIVAKVSETVDVSLLGRVEYRDFRLDDSRPAWSDGIVRDLRVPIGVEVAWKPIAGLTLALEGGVAVYQEYEFLDDDGDHLSDVETEPAPFIGFRVEYTF